MADLWLRVDERHKGGEPVTDLLSRIEYGLQLTDRWPRVDCTPMVPGLAVSARAKGCLESLGVPGMQFLEFRINGGPFFRFYTDRVVDCLDRSKSDLELFRSSGRVTRVHRYAFVEDQLRACDVFAIPERSQGMFFWSQETLFTGLAGATLERHGLVGFRFEELPGQG